MPGFRLSLTQMMKLVLFAAVASASVAPMAHLREAGVIGSWIVVILWGGVAAPLACALMAFLVIRRGPFKDWLIRAFLLASVGVALGYAIYLEAWAAYLATRGKLLYDFSFIETAGVIALLGFAAAVLLLRVIPRWCPVCRLPALIPDVSARGGNRTENDRAYRCLACDDLYWKHNGGWESARSGGAAQ